jgi:hypothetical protein
MICRSTDRWSGWALRENSTTALMFWMPRWRRGTAA